MAITDPTDITGLVMWLDASQETGFTDGDPVGTWTDQSGTGNHATSSGGDRPLWRSGVQNGLAALEFDGTDDHMDVPDPGIFDCQAGTTFVVARNTNTSTSTRYAISFTAGPSSDRENRWYLHVLDGQFRVSVGEGGADLGGEQWFDKWHVRWLRADGDDKAAVVQPNCVGFHTFTDSDTGVATTNGGIGSHVGLSQFWDGYIAEIVHYSRGLTDAEAFDVSIYLHIKWGIVCGWTIGAIAF